MKKISLAIVAFATFASYSPAMAGGNQATTQWSVCGQKKFRVGVKFEPGKPPQQLSEACTPKKAALKK